MARPLRVEYPGALYHITARGVAQQPIFFDDKDRERFLELLGEVHERFGFLFHGYCLLSNHVHLQVETREGNLSRGMQWLGQAYASHVNRRRGRAGHLFQGRFKSAVVEKDAYLHALTRYVHLNPVRAKMVKSPSEYRWSSYRAYLGLAPSPPWLETQETLMRFGRSLREARRAYRAFVEESAAENPMGELRWGFALGREGFVERAREMLRGRKGDSEVAGLGKAVPRPTLSYIIAAVCESYGIERARLEMKWGRGNEPRDVAVYLASRACGMALREIAPHFGGLSVPALSLASRRVRDRLAEDKKFARRIRSVETQMAQRAKIKQ